MVKNMKKEIAILLTMAMLQPLAGCARTSTPPAQETGTGQTDTVGPNAPGTEQASPETETFDQVYDYRKPLK